MQLTHEAFPHVAPHPGRLSYKEKTEVNKQIQVLIKLGKMKNSDYEYAYRVSLPIKKDGCKQFCGDYKLLNM
jgi:hypothetical protein